MRKLTRLPRKKKEFVSGTSYTPSLKHWRRVAAKANKGDGETLYWWVMAIDADDTRQVTDMQSLTVGE